MNIKILNSIGLLTFAIPIYSSLDSLLNDEPNMPPIHIIDNKQNKEETLSRRIKNACLELEKTKLTKKSRSKLEQLHSIELPEKSTFKDAIHTIITKNTSTQSIKSKLFKSLTTKLHYDDQKNVDDLLEKYNLEKKTNKELMKLMIDKELKAKKIEDEKEDDDKEEEDEDEEQDREKEDKWI